MRTLRLPSLPFLKVIFIFRCRERSSSEPERRPDVTDRETIWDGEDSYSYSCPSGVYLLRNTNETNQVKKISKIE